MSDAKHAVGPADLADGQMKSVKVGRETLLVAKVRGEHFALDDWCNHAGCLLSGGRIVNGKVICPCHEMGFDLRTGRVATEPVLCDDQRAFPIEERDGTLFVDLEPAAKPEGGS